MSNLRVISGSAKGTRLRTLEGDETRPILDRVKESLFDIERPTLAGTKWLDLFGGTGAVGIEALSGGAEHCTFIELRKEAVQAIRANLESCQLNQLAMVRHQDAFSFLKTTKESFHRIFVAPPQYKGIWIEALQYIAERPELLADTPPANSDEPESFKSKVIVQIDPKEYERLALVGFKELPSRRYGNTLLVWYELTS